MCRCQSPGPGDEMALKASAFPSVDRPIHPKCRRRRMFCRSTRRVTLRADTDILAALRDQHRG